MYQEDFFLEEMAGGKDYDASPRLPSGWRLEVSMHFSSLSSIHATNVFPLPALNDDEGWPAKISNFATGYPVPNGMACPTFGYQCGGSTRQVSPEVLTYSQREIKTKMKKKLVLTDKSINVFIAYLTIFNFQPIQNTM